MAISRNKYRIGICLVVFGTVAIGAALGTLYRPAPVAERVVAPLPREMRAAPRPLSKPAPAAVKPAQADVPETSDDELAAVLPARRAKSTAAAPKAPSLAYSPDMLVNPIEFKDPQFARRATVLDARFWDFYLPKHIAGSINTDCKEWVAAFTSDPSQPSWEKRIAALGIDRNAPVVICDDGVNKEAAAVRAILRYWGFTDVRLLNGGWHAWLFAGGPVDGRTPHRTSRPVQLEPAAGLFVTADQVVELAEGRQCSSRQRVCYKLFPTERRPAVRGNRRQR